MSCQYTLTTVSASVLHIEKRLGGKKIRRLHAIRVRCGVQFYRLDVNVNVI